MRAVWHPWCVLSILKGWAWSDPPPSSSKIRPGGLITRLFESSWELRTGWAFIESFKSILTCRGSFIKVIRWAHLNASCFMILTFSSRDIAGVTSHQLTYLSELAFILHTQLRCSHADRWGWRWQRRAECREGVAAYRWDIIQGSFTTAFMTSILFQMCLKTNLQA